MIVLYELLASAALNVRVNNKCNNMASSWYDAESTCSIQGGHIDTTTTTFCDETNSVENTANWHGSVIIEKIIWNTYIIPTRGVQRSLDCKYVFIYSVYRRYGALISGSPNFN